MTEKEKGSGPPDELDPTELAETQTSPGSASNSEQIGPYRLLRELPTTALAAAALDRLVAAGAAVTAVEEAAVRAGQDDHWAALAAIVDHLLAHETLEGELVEEIMGQWLR